MAACLLAGLALAPFLTRGPAAGDVTSEVRTPTADAHVVATKPGANFGSAKVLRLDAKPVIRSYLTFQVETTTPIVGATLRVYSALGSPAGFSVHGVEDTTWGESTITYSNAPAHDPLAAASGPVPAGAWTSVDVSVLVDGAGPVGLALMTTTRTAFTVNSRQSGATAPQLVVRTSTGPDVDPPTTPGDLTATATGATRVQLRWTESIDDVGVAGYDVFREEVLVDTVDGDTFAYVDTGLAPEGTYSYGVEAFDASGKRSARAGPVMATTPAVSTAPVVVAVGDIACDPAASGFNGGQGTATHCRQMDTSDLALSLDPTAALTLGDLQYNCGGYSAFLQSYDPSWGRLRAITYPAPGNHEYESWATSPSGTGCSPAPDAAGYYSYFGDAAGDPGQGWYSVEIGTWHVVALNSALCNWGGCASTSPQAAWLQADLAASDAACTLAFMHHPRFSSGPHGNTTGLDAFWQLLHAEGAEIVLSGHDHLYERFTRMDPTQQPDPLGPRAFVVGTGGKGNYAVSSVQAGSEVRIADRFGVLELTLFDGSYSWRFVPTTGEPALDSGTESCH